VGWPRIALFTFDLNGADFRSKVNSSFTNDFRDCEYGARAMTVARTETPLLSTSSAELFQEMSDLISLREKVAQAELRARAKELRIGALEERKTESGS
jgi:hypothetical protein